jgi:putative transposase
VSTATISRVTDKMLEEMTDWAATRWMTDLRPVFIDAVAVKVAMSRSPTSPSTPLSGSPLPAGATSGHGARQGSEVAKLWSVLTYVRNRGVRDMFASSAAGLGSTASSRPAARNNGSGGLSARTMTF